MRLIFQVGSAALENDTDISSSMKKKYKINVTVLESSK